MDNNISPLHKPKPREYFKMYGKKLGIVWDRVKKREYYTQDHKITIDKDSINFDSHKLKDIKMANNRMYLVNKEMEVAVLIAKGWGAGWHWKRDNAEFMNKVLSENSYDDVNWVVKYESDKDVNEWICWHKED